MRTCVGWRQEAGKRALIGLVRGLHGTVRPDPIHGLEEVPDWLIGNLRAEGPPPAEGTLDLDTLDLHV